VIDPPHQAWRKYPHPSSVPVRSGGGRDGLRDRIVAWRPVMQTRMLFTFWLGVCLSVLLTVTSGLAQDSNTTAGQASTVNGARHDPDQAQSPGSAAERGTFYQPKTDEIQVKFPQTQARKGDQLVSAPSTTTCSNQQSPWCWPSISRAFSAAYNSFGPDAVKRCNWCRSRR
jgi:hypothetical protein